MASDLTMQERLNDVILKVPHEGFSWRIPAHSLLLVSKSSKFQEMLDERAEDERPTPIPLIGMRPETALAVLKYIYENKFPTVVTADLLIAADKYKLVPLQDNLEERLMEDMTIRQACEVLEELNIRYPADYGYAIKTACYNMLEIHALTVFGSDMILCLGKKTLTGLLMADRLNIPDDMYLFWGIWRWGRRESSKNGRSQRDEDVASYIDDLIVLIRKSNLRSRAGIPEVASERFDSCKCRRTRYACPADILKHSISLRPCPTWEDIIAPKTTELEESPFCIQLSVEEDVMLVGLSLEMFAHDSRSRTETFIRVFQETDCTEVCRQKIGWCLSSMRRLSPRVEPECRMESEVAFNTPLFLVPGNIYSVQLVGNFSNCHFIWGSFRRRRMKVGNTFVNFHGQGVCSVREIYVIPDVSVTWGPRSIEM